MAIERTPEQIAAFREDMRRIEAKKTPAPAHPVPAWRDDAHGNVFDDLGGLVAVCPAKAYAAEIVADHNLRAECARFVLRVSVGFEGTPLGEEAAALLAKLEG